MITHHKKCTAKQTIHVMHLPCDARLCSNSIAFGKTPRGGAPSQAQTGVNDHSWATNLFYPCQPFSSKWVPKPMAGA